MTCQHNTSTTLSYDTTSSSQAMPVTDLFITYGDALAPAGYHRVTLPDGGEAELNRGFGSTSSYLWYCSDGKNDPIAEISVQNSNSSVPKGFELVSRNILFGSNEEAYLLMRRSKEEDPIHQIRLLYNVDDNPSLGFEKLLPPICQKSNGTGVWLTVARSERGEKYGSGTICASECDPLISLQSPLVFLYEQMSRQPLDSEPTEMETQWEIVESVVESLLTASHSPEIVHEINTSLKKVMRIIVEYIHWIGFLNTKQVNILFKIFCLNSRSHCYYTQFGVGLANGDGYADPSRDYSLSGPAVCLNEKSNRNQSRKSTWESLTNSISTTFNGALVKVKDEKTIDFKRLKFLVTNINFFASIGGFDCLVSALSQSSIVEMKRVVLLLRSLAQRLLKKEFLDPLLPRIQQNVTERFLALSDENCRLAENIFKSVWSDIECLFINCRKEQQFTECYFQFCLAFCKKLLSSPTVALKLKGVDLLNDILEKSFRVSAMKKSDYFLNPSYLHSWLSEENIIELLLGDLCRSDLTPHDEILRKSVKVFVFIAKRQKECPEHYAKALWKIGDAGFNGKTVSELCSRSAFALLKHLSCFFSARVAMYFLEEVRSLQDSMRLNFNEEYIALVIDFMENLLEHMPISTEGNTPEFQQNNGNDLLMSSGLEILWSFLSISTCFPPEEHKLDCDSYRLQLCSAKALASVLSKKHFEPKLANILSKSIRRIEELEEVLCSQENIPIERYFQESIGHFLFFKSIFDNVIGSDKSDHFKSCLGRKGEVLILTNRKCHQMLNVLTGYISVCLKWKKMQFGNELLPLCFNSINNCVEVLATLLSLSEDLHLGLDHMTELCNAFNSEPQECRDIFHRMMESVCIAKIDNHDSSNLTANGLTYDALEFVLNTYFAKSVDLSKLSRHGFAALKNVFLSVIHRSGSMRPVNNEKADVNDIVGLRVLLQVNLEVSDEEISQLARDLLVTLQVSFGGHSDRRSKWTAFVTSCFDWLLEEYSFNKFQENISQAKRFLDLVKEFFEALYKLDKHPPRTGSQNEFVIPQRVAAFWKREDSSMRGSKNYVFKKGAVTVGSFRALLAKDLKVSSPKLIRLVSPLRVTIESGNDHLLIEDANISSFVDVTILSKAEIDTVNFIPTIPAALLADDPESDQMAPRKVVSESSHYFGFLIDLLSNEDLFSENSSTTTLSAWNVISMLPTNPSILFEVKTLGGVISPAELSSSSFMLPNSDVVWSNILSFDNNFMMFYKLRVIRSLILPLYLKQNNGDIRLAEPSALTAAEHWCDAFIDKGGVVCLKECIELLCSRSLHSDLLKQCISLCIELLLTCLRHRKSFLECFGVGHADVVLNKIVSSMKETLLHLRTSNSFAHISSVAKLSRKLSRANRFEKYFRDEIKNTSGEECCGQTNFYSTSQSFCDDDCDVSCDSQLIDNSMQLLHHLFKEMKETFVQLVLAGVSGSEWKSILCAALFYSNDDLLRNAFCDGLLKLCAEERNLDEQSTVFRRTLLDRMVNILPNSSTSFSFAHCTEYFGLLSELISSPGALQHFEKPEQALHLNQLCIKFADLMLYHTPVERTDEDEDDFAQGLLLVFDSLLGSAKTADEDKFLDILQHLGKSRHLIYHTFHNFLFSTEYHEIPCQPSCAQSSKNLHAFPICKSPKSRVRAFSLLKTLCLHKDNLRQLISLIQPHHCLSSESNNIMSKSLKRFQKSIGVPKSPSGYCGLRNPSCICYLNSTIQQLFHVQSFRNGILQLQYTEGKDSSSGMMMFQLQQMFASLQESDQAFVDPISFCKSFKDYDGRPINVYAQQDASEFLAKLFQQVENFLMGSGEDNLLKNIFGGVLSNELLATSADGSPRHSERPEPFFILSVPVGSGRERKILNLDDALSSFTQDETVEYIWENEKDSADAPVLSEEIQPPAQESLSTIKRVGIKKLPEHLIIHLKRFDFDFQIMQQVKINDRFEFPLTLDMFPYTVAGRNIGEEKDAAAISKSDDESTQVGSSESEIDHEHCLGPDECLYELAGVVVHAGTAHSGHYYSLIRDRSTVGESCWFEFNDCFVSDFDLDDLEMETFGGLKPKALSSESVSGKAKTVFQTKNAFILVYDRVTSGGLIEKVSTAKIPKTLLDTVKLENFHFWLTKTVYDETYYKFLTETFLPGASETLQVVNLREASSEVETFLNLALQITFGTFCQAGQKNKLRQWTLWIVDQMRRKPLFAFMVLQTIIKAGGCSDEDWTAALLLFNNDKEGRLCAKKMISVAMVIVLSDAQFSLPANAAKYSSSHDQLNAWEANEGEAVSLTLVEHLMSQLLPYAQQEQHKLDVFFTPISVLAKNSASCRVWMKEHDYLSHLLSFILALDAPATSHNGVKNIKSRPASGSDGVAKANFFSLLSAVAALLPGGSTKDITIFKDSGAEVVAGGSDICEDEASDGKENIDSVSNKNLELMRSPIFMYKLSQALRDPENKRFVQQIFQFVINGSKALTESCTHVIISAMKKEDDMELKPALRCAMILCHIDDNLRGWRVSYVLQKVAMEIKGSLKYIRASDVSLSMLLRICKTSIVAAEWLRLNYKQSLKWIETYLITRRNGGIPQSSLEWKPTSKGSKVSTSSKSGQDTSVSSASSRLRIEMDLQLLKKIINGHYKGDDNGNSKPQWKLFSHATVTGGGYDSDDDPFELIGMRIQIQEKTVSRFAKVSSFDKKTKRHLVKFENGEEKFYMLENTLWRVPE